MPRLTTPKKNAKTAAMEAEILRTATAIISERGYHGTTLDDIAEAAKIARRTFYSYFASKDDILRHIYSQVFATSKDAAEKISLEKIPAQEKLRRLIRHQVGGMTANTALHRVFFIELANLPGPLGRLVAKTCRAYSQIFEDVIAEGIRTGTMVPLDPKRFSYLLLGMCNWMHRWYRPEDEWGPDAIADEIIGVLENGYLRHEKENGNDVIMKELRVLRQGIEKIQNSLP